MRRSRHAQATNAQTGRREYAMYNENEVRIIGNLGRDPRVHDGGDGRKVVQLSVAANRSWKGSDGEWQTATDWIPVTAFNTLAETAAEKLRKGSLVLIKGRIRTQELEVGGGGPRQSGVCEAVLEFGPALQSLLDLLPAPGQ